MVRFEMVGNGQPGCSHRFLAEGDNFERRSGIGTEFLEQEGSFSGGPEHNRSISDPLVGKITDLTWVKAGKQLLSER